MLAFFGNLCFITLRLVYRGIGGFHDPEKKLGMEIALYDWQTLRMT